MSVRLKLPLLPGLRLGAGKLMPGALAPTTLVWILEPAARPRQAASAGKDQLAAQAQNLASVTGVVDESARPQPGGLTCDAVDEALQRLGELGVLAAPGAAVQHVLQGHEQAEDVALMPPEQAVAVLREGDAP